MFLLVFLALWAPVSTLPAIKNVVTYQISVDGTLPPDVDYETHLSVSETIKYRGFQPEEHTVTTADGYILTLQRIAPASSDAPPVLLWHGLLDSAFTWVSNSRQQSLAFILADNGFDVWLGNSRGSKYSRAHVKYNPNKDFNYWQFSFDEMAKYDIPAAVNYVRNVTKHDKISWVGHSQGCLIAFAGFIDPEIAKSINVFVALAPAARVDNVKSGIRYIAPFATTIESALTLFGSTGEFLPNNNLMVALGRVLCGDEPIICEDVIFLVAGYNVTNINQTRLPVYISHTPAGTSTQNLVHYSQSILQKQFQYFDYGPLRNMEVYGERRPPLYDVSKMTVPTAFFWSPEDELADQVDVLWLLGKTAHVVRNQTIDGYSHLDFTWASNAHEYLYPEVVTLLRQYV